MVSGIVVNAIILGFISNSLCNHDTLSMQNNVIFAIILQ